MWSGITSVSLSGRGSRSRLNCRILASLDLYIAAHAALEPGPQAIAGVGGILTALQLPQVEPLRFLSGPGACLCLRVPHQHVGPGPARNSHQAAFRPASGEPTMRRCVPQPMWMKTAHTGHLGAHPKRLVHRVIGEVLASVGQPQRRIGFDGATYGRVGICRSRRLCPLLAEPPCPYRPCRDGG
jgi:hypothetical protein